MNGKEKCELSVHVKTFPRWYLPISFKWHLFKVSFPKKAGQWVTIRSFFPNDSNCLVFVVEEFWSKCLDILHSAIVKIWEVRSFWPEWTLKLRHLFLQPYQGALGLGQEHCRCHLRRWSTVHLWTLHCILLRLWRCRPEAQLAPYISGGVLHVRRYSGDRGPSNSRSELFLNRS